MGALSPKRTFCASTIPYITGSVTLESVEKAHQQAPETCVLHAGTWAGLSKQAQRNVKKNLGLKSKPTLFLRKK
jgi:hypothetical protein